MRDPLLIPACLFAAGVAFSRADWVTGPTAAGFAGFLMMLALGGILIRKRWVVAVCGSLAILLAGTANMALRPRLEPPQGARAGKQLIDGCVVESAAVMDERAMVVIQAKGLGGVRVNTPVGAGLPVYGEVVRGEANVRPVRNFGLEGSFDRETFLSRQGVFWQASMASKGKWERTGDACGNPLLATLDRLRRAAQDRLARLYPEPRKAALLRALLLGDGVALRRSWVEDFRRTGTYHALVISGGHITMICGLFLIWRRHVGWGANGAILLAALIAWFYSAVAGGATPALRAAAAMSLSAAGMLLFRTPRLLNILAAVTLVFLAADPGQLFEASFQLSFLAVGAIGLLAQPWLTGERVAGRLPRPWEVELELLAATLALTFRTGVRWWVVLLRSIVAGADWTGQALLVSAAVQLGLLLPMVVYFHRLSLSGLIANVVVTPLISAAIPVGFLALLTGSGPIAGAAGWLISVAQRLAGYFAGLEPDWPVPEPPGWLAAAFVCCLMIAILALRRGRLVALGPLAAALAAAVIVIHPFPQRQNAGELELTLLDTGQSESLLVGLPQGGFVLVDTGGTPGRPSSERRFDVGEDLIAPYLWSRGIRRLDGIVLTHLHEDHAGGAPFLIRSFRPRTLWTSYAPDHASWRRLKSELLGAGTQIRTAGEGDKWRWGEVEVRALAPSPEQRWRGKPSNNDSLILLITYGRRRFLLAGDAERGVGDRLAEDGLLEKVDVLKMPHHGAKSALSASMLQATHPALALISAGWLNSFGFPHAETLDALDANGSIALRTDLLGTLTVRSDGRSLSFESHAGSGL